MPQSFIDEKQRLTQEVADLRRHNGPLRDINTSERALEMFPRDAAAARIVWTQQREALLMRASAPVPMSEPFPAISDEDRQTHERNFLSLLLCLSLGTASLPHILTRYNTTTSVASARRSVGWTLFFVALFYLTVPVLAVLIKYEILTNLVGHPFADLPQWLTQWRKDRAESDQRRRHEPRRHRAAGARSRCSRIWWCWPRRRLRGCRM